MNLILYRPQLSFKLIHSSHGLSLSRFLCLRRLADRVDKSAVPAHSARKNEIYLARVQVFDEDHRRTSVCEKAVAGIVYSKPILGGQFCSSRSTRMTACKNSNRILQNVALTGTNLGALLVTLRFPPWLLGQCSRTSESGRDPTGKGDVQMRMPRAGASEHATQQ
jgi:hypothetical protein